MLNKIIRNALLSLLGEEHYLRLVSYIFLRMFYAGYFKKKYPEMYLLNKFIRSGDICIDIGANLGYYTIPMAQLCGGSGRIYAVEPISLFRKILSANLESYKLSGRVEVVPYALGSSDNEEIKMGTPSVDGLIHFGYTKVLSGNQEEIKTEYQVKSFTAKTLFNHLTRLHFIKCDVEGYEHKVIPEFADLIRKFRPSLQVEITVEENKKFLFEFFQALNYNICHQKDGVIESFNKHSQVDTSDYYFIPK